MSNTKTAERCVSGCKAFTGGEIKHHKDCPFYKDSLSERLDFLEEYANQFKAETPSLPSQPVSETSIYESKKFGTEFEKWVTDMKAANSTLTPKEFLKQAALFGIKYARLIKPTPQPTDNSFEEEAAELYRYKDVEKALPGYEKNTYRGYNEMMRQHRTAYIKGRQKNTSLERDRLAGEAWDAAWKRLLCETSSRTGNGIMPPDKETYLSNLNKK